MISLLGLLHGAGNAMRIDIATPPLCGTAQLHSPVKRTSGPLMHVHVQAQQGQLKDMPFSELSYVLVRRQCCFQV